MANKKTVIEQAYSAFNQRDIGFATGKIKATHRTFEDDWVFAITVRNGKLTNVRKYVDTQALARASVATQRNGSPFGCFVVARATSIVLPDSPRIRNSDAHLSS